MDLNPIIIGIAGGTGSRKINTCRKYKKRIWE